MTSAGGTKPVSVLAVMAVLTVTLVASLVLTALDDPVELIGEIDSTLFLIVVMVSVWRGYQWGWGLGVFLGVGYLGLSLLGFAGLDRVGPERPAIPLAAGIAVLALLFLPSVRAHCGIRTPSVGGSTDVG